MTPVQPSLGVQAFHDLTGATGHRSYSRATVPGPRKLTDILSSRPRGLLTRDVGFHIRPAEDTDVDEDGIDLVFAQPVA
jgi:hypothetical protein